MNLPPAPISMPMTQPERSPSMPVPRVPIPMPAPVPQHAPMPAPVPALAAPFTDTLHGYEGAAAARFGFPSPTSPSLSPQEAAHAAWVRAGGIYRGACGTSTSRMRQATHRRTAARATPQRSTPHDAATPYMRRRQHAGILQHAAPHNPHEEPANRPLHAA